MKSSEKIVTLFNLFVIIIAFTQIHDLLTQLNDGSLKKWLVTKEQIANNSAISLTTERTNEFLVPRIIHQTYKNTTIPEKWIHTQNSVVEHNRDFEYKFWTDESAREFLKKYYPWFVPTYDSYKFPIMRSDAMRYFILYHYGGFYIDLDIGVHKSLDPLRRMPTAFYKTSPLGVSNGFMASAPGHPFFSYIMHSLKKYNRNWFSSYLTVMYSTGPLFVSVLLQKYNWMRRAPISSPDDTSLYMMKAAKDSIYQPLSDFIYHTSGSSWHKNDAWLFLFINDHQRLASFVIPLVVTILVVFFIGLEMKLADSVLQYFRRRNSSRHYKLASKFES